MAPISDQTIEQFREPLFVAVLLIGAVVFSMAGAFFVVAISINTAPPAPYVSPTDKRFLIVGSAVAMILGAVLVRTAARIVGW